MELPTIRMTAAFAREVDAKLALGILSSSTGRLVSSQLRPIAGEDGRIDIILLDVEVADLEPDRVATAITGAHGVVIPGLAGT
jgi:hypothetical protein